MRAFLVSRLSDVWESNLRKWSFKNELCVERCDVSNWGDFIKMCKTRGGSAPSAPDTKSRAKCTRLVLYRVQRIASWTNFDKLQWTWFSLCWRVWRSGCITEDAMWAQQHLLHVGFVESGLVPAQHVIGQITEVCIVQRVHVRGPGAAEPASLSAFQHHHWKRSSKESVPQETGVL